MLFTFISPRKTFKPLIAPTKRFLKCFDHWCLSAGMVALYHHIVFIHFLHILVCLHLSLDTVFRENRNND